VAPLARLCSRNEGKLRELRAVLVGWRIELLDIDDYPPEVGDTYYENALAKARFGRDSGDAAEWMIGEDSGIEAAGLGGRPGIHSARYGGPGATDEENLAKLLREAPAGSPVAYVCAMAFVDAQREHVVEGRCTGVLASEPRGDGGFGYDPAFLPDDLGDGRTMAELAPEEKDAISHRGRAARALLHWLEERADGSERPASAG